MIRRTSRNLALAGVAATLLATVFAAKGAFAEVKREGEWPSSDKNVSLDVAGSRSEAVKRIADAAGWSVVTDGVGEGNVDLHIKDQPPGRVLDLVLDDGAYVATREGTLVRVRRATAAAAPEAPAAPKAEETKATEPKKEEAKPAEKKDPNKKGEDRTIFGSNVTIEADEVVEDLTVFGGNVDVLGHVRGDLTVFGGNVHVRENVHVDGDASLLGGNLTLESGAVIGKDVSVLGGNLSRAEGASVHGKVKRDLHVHADSSPDAKSFLGRVGERLASMAMLLVFGTILLALTPTRMESMRLEAAARPMRSFALGAVALAAALPVTVVLFITIIGIPIWFVAAFLAFIGGTAGVTAVLTTFGAAVLQHRTESPYVHLALGVAALGVVGMIPWIGAAVSWIVIALGLGVLFGSRGAGYFVRRKNNGPYRSDASVV